MKTCSKCEKTKETSAFSVDRSMMDGLNRWCRACLKYLRDSNKPIFHARQARYRAKKRPKLRAAGRAYYYANKHRFKTRQRRVILSKYGLTQERFDQMVNYQNGKCAICGTDKPRRKKDKHLHVDHCHKTGKVRALLCSGCNLGLGAFADNDNALIVAAVYLRIHKQAA